APKDKPSPPDQPPQRVPAKPGTEFTGKTQADVAALVSEFSKVTPSAQEAFLEATRTLERYRRMSPQIEDALRDLLRTTDEMQVTSRSWGRVGERVDVLIQTNQDKLIKTLDTLNDTVVRVASVFSDENQRNLATTLKNASAGSKNLESIAKNTDELLKE